jgi:hypothetical protein
VRAWLFSGQPSSGPPSYRASASRPSDPARPMSVRSVVHAHFRSPTSRVPFALNLLSRGGSRGCSLCSEHEASDSPPFPCHSRRMGETGHWLGMTICLIGRLGGESDREIASDKSKLKLLGTGYPPRIEQCVCMWKGSPVRHARNERRCRAEFSLSSKLKVTSTDCVADRACSYELKLLAAVGKETGRGEVVVVGSTGRAVNYGWGFNHTAAKPGLSQISVRVPRSSIERSPER